MLWFNNENYFQCQRKTNQGQIPPPESNGTAHLSLLEVFSLCTSKINKK